MKTLAVSQSARGSLLCRALIGSAAENLVRHITSNVKEHMDRDVVANDDFPSNKCTKGEYDSLFLDEPDIMH